jgi:hypothetical protein
VARACVGARSHRRIARASRWFVGKVNSKEDGDFIMAILSRNTNLAAGAKTAACMLTLIVACSSSSSGSNDAGSLQTGVTAVNDAGMAGCSTLQPGCYTYDGTYPTPATSATCSKPGAPATGAADTHCSGVTPQTVAAASCSVSEAGPGDDSSGDDAGASADAAAGADAGATPAPGQCGENGSDYGATMYGTEGDDDDCKYHASYSVTPVCENDGTYFTVKANYLTRNSAPLTGACTFAELCLNDTHPMPNIDGTPPVGMQKVVEGPPGTYTIGPVQFDAPGKWTVRFHFNEICCDVADDSPHGHAAFFLNVP